MSEGAKAKPEYWRYPNSGIYEVRPPYYPASCDNCGWQGSSEKCGTDTWGDDSDVYCPACQRPGCDIGDAAERAIRVNRNGRPLEPTP
jgi:hypothetical protein